MSTNIRTYLNLMRRTQNSHLPWAQARQRTQSSPPQWYCHINTHTYTYIKVHLYLMSNQHNKHAIHILREHRHVNVHNLFNLNCIVTWIHTHTSLKLSHKYTQIYINKSHEQQRHVTHVFHGHRHVNVHSLLDLNDIVLVHIPVHVHNLLHGLVYVPNLCV